MIPYALRKEREAVMQALRGTLEMKSAKLLLMSSRLSDVRFAARLLQCEKVSLVSAEVVSHALVQSNEEIIWYMASEECFDFKEHAQKAFVGDLAVVVDDEIWWDDYPVSTLQLLTNPSLDLELDYPTAMKRAIIKGHDLEVVQFLAQFEETKVVAFSEKYLYYAVYNGVLREDIFRFLLGLDGVEVDQEIVDEALDAYNSYLHSDTSFYDALKANPKTREYVLAYEERPARYDESDSD